MIMKLPDELREPLQQSPKEVRLVDDQTHAVYFVIDEETHRRAMRALKEQEDNDAIAEGLQQMEAGAGRPLREVDAAIQRDFELPPRT
ncbi:MAG: hypothetical protein IIA67_00565 [Planctomycetes bacterium]|nr:hypothetical protein [Planctomycetota bacterium]